ncbi:MAG: hypothetical protein AAGB31_12050 [Bdellovibrio sp.]
MGSNVVASSLSSSASVSTSGNIQTTGDITSRRFFLYDHSGAGPDSIGIQAPADIAGAGGASYVLTLPENKGSAGQVLAAKNASGVLEWITLPAAGVSSVTAASPLSIDNSTASAPRVSLPQATTSVSGYLSSSDFTTFSNKQAAGNYITTLTGDVTSSSFTSGSVTTTLASGSVHQLSKVVSSPGSAGPNRILATDATTGTTIQDFYCTTIGHYLKWTGTSGFGCAGIASADIADLETTVDARIEAQKGVASGVAGLDTNSRVPASQLGSGTANSTTYLRGDGSWASISTSGGTDNVTTTSYTVTSAQNGYALSYNGSAAGTFQLPVLSAVNEGFKVIVVRQVREALTLAAASGDVFRNGASSFELRGKNLAAATVIKLASKWNIINGVDDCVVGQSCWETGMIYVGVFNGYQYFTTPGGCTNSATPDCAGGTDSVAKAWGGSSPESDTSLGFNNTSDGKAQSAALALYTTARAAQYCESMEYANYTDWYLPAWEELMFMFPRKVELGGFAASGYYWSSTEASASTAYQFGFGNALQTSASKIGSTHKVRCMRRF